MEPEKKTVHARTAGEETDLKEQQRASGGIEDQGGGRGVKRAIAAAAKGTAHQLLQNVSKKSRRSIAKDRSTKIPPPVLGKRSSIYRGVTRHRWTGRFEAHLWDKSAWNQSQNKKGKQVYLGAYDDEQAAARAYDLAALKYWGPGTVINFQLTDYATDIQEMQNASREEYLACLRRKSSGFSRGVSKYRGVARHHHNGRWEARIGRVFGNKYLYLGTYSTQEEAAAAYDMAAIEYRGLNAVTNFDLSRYIKWLHPAQSSELSKNQGAGNVQQQHFSAPECADEKKRKEEEQEQILAQQACDSYLGFSCNNTEAAAAPTALGLLWQSNVFKQMLEKASADVSSDEGMAMAGVGGGIAIFPGLEEESGLDNDAEGLVPDLSLQFPPFTEDSGSPLWISLPLRSPISV